MVRKHFRTVSHPVVSPAVVRRELLLFSWLDPVKITVALMSRRFCLTICLQLVPAGMHRRLRILLDRVEMLVAS